MGEILPLKESVKQDHWLLLDSVDAAIVLIDQAYSILHLNPTAERLIAQAGVASAGWQGRNCVDLLQTSKAQAAFHDGSRPVITIGNLTLGGSVKSFDAGSDSSAGFLVTLTDITSQRRLVSAVDVLSDGVESGELSGRIEAFPENRVAEQIGTGVNSIMGHVQNEMTDLLTSVELLAECNLDITMLNREELRGEFEQIHKGFIVTLSNLTESIRQTIRSSEQIASAVSAISQQNVTLEERTRSQAEFLRETTSNIEEFSSTTENAAENAQQAATQGQHINQLTREGRSAVDKVLESMESINQSSSQADQFIGLINDIAFQTSILSMNATIEAARAGEQGKGFAVVAQEVRMLSVRTTEASKSIKELIEKSVSLSKFGKQVAQEADSKIVQISDNIQAYSEKINSISDTAHEQTQGIRKVNDAIQKLDHITHSNNQLIAELAINTKHLDRQAVDLKDAAMVFQLPNSQFSHDLHRLAYNVARETAQYVGQTFENAVNRALISAADLFSHEYSLIPKTDPAKHTSRFDGFTDNALPEIQESVLRDHPEFIYAITADYNGYVPTHNNKFCQPLTGDYQQDLSGNRTKRVFSDRVGQLVGRNEEPFILQTYRRDTGELMFDMSVPIVVLGKHWGGFRIGYRIT